MRASGIWDGPPDELWKLVQAELRWHVKKGDRDYIGALNRLVLEQIGQVELRRLGWLSPSTCYIGIIAVKVRGFKPKLKIGWREREPVQVGGSLIALENRGLWLIDGHGRLRAARRAGTPETYDVVIVRPINS